MKKVLVTGGAGFIGSNFVRLVRRERPDVDVVVLDKLTYAGRLENLAEFENDAKYRFVKGDICDARDVAEAMQGCDTVINFAAETHVDRSLMGGDELAGAFVQTDVYGVYILLEEARRQNVDLFLQISTDEVYGDVEEGHSVESDPLSPRSPYSAAKAGGELMARSYGISHGLPVIITRGSNNFGPYQYPEKLIPLFITNAIDDQPLPLYGDGLQRRDWILAEDHCRGVLIAVEQGTAGETYNVGGGNEKNNREITYAILELLGKPESLIRPVQDRPGHDRRYALSTDKIRGLGYAPQRSFEEDLAATVQWYQQNQSWWRPLKSDSEYRKYYEKNYANKGA
ncbi:MAG TPA: dTDP-glucose 4,6-dehydratase [Abditibacteriaceae bacterium]|nr:dTDP-glucose 4,6-dehydratase [Abditibacteriaceae bacterium]